MPSNKKSCTHPFCVLGEAGEYSRPIPLCPWQDEAHARYYVSVDNTQAAFDLFVEHLRSWTTPPYGHTALVHGEAGCGKTSLIHRCAHACAETLRNAHGLAVVIVDLTDENWSAQPADAKLYNALEAVLYEVTHGDGTLPAHTAEELRGLGVKSPLRASECFERALDDIEALLAPIRFALRDEIASSGEGMRHHLEPFRAGKLFTGTSIFLARMLVEEFRSAIAGALNRRLAMDSDDRLEAVSDICQRCDRLVASLEPEMFRIEIPVHLTLDPTSESRSMQVKRVLSRLEGLGREVYRSIREDRR